MGKVAEHGVLTNELQAVIKLLASLMGLSPDVIMDDSVHRCLPMRHKVAMGQWTVCIEDTEANGNSSVTVLCCLH